jgi:hypothetical protein
MSYVGDNVSLTLIGRLARRDDVHDESADAAVRRERDLGVPLVHARKSVHIVDRQCVSAAHDVLDCHRIVAKSRDEPVAFFGLAWAACRDCKRQTGE